MTEDVRDVLLAMGARFGPLMASEELLDFGAPEREYEAARSAAALFELSDRGKLDVLGGDRARFLNGQVSNDVLAPRPGEGCRAALLDRQSHVLAELRVYALEDRIEVDLDRSALDRTVQRLARHILASDVQLRDRTAELGLFSLQGPLALALAERLTGVSAVGLAEYGHLGATFQTHSLRLRRSSRAGGPGVDILHPADASLPLWRALVEAGATPAGMTAMEAVRIEAGIPRYGADVTESHLVQEAAYPDAVSFTKGCYTGQEVVARVRSRGHVNRLRCGLVVDGPALPGDEVRAEGRRIGEVTSSARSLRLGATVCQATLKARWARMDGAAVAVHGREGETAGRVSAFPMR